MGIVVYCTFSFQNLFGSFLKFLSYCWSCIVLLISFRHLSLVSSLAILNTDYLRYLTHNSNDHAFLGEIVISMNRWHLLASSHASYFLLKIVHYERYNVGNSGYQIIPHFQDFFFCLLLWVVLFACLVTFPSVSVNFVSYNMHSFKCLFL
jgi:hypothetical protein